MPSINYIEMLKQAILNFDILEARRRAEGAIEAGVDPVEAIEKGLAPGIREVGERFHNYEIFLPHVVLAADAMTEAMKVLEAAVPRARIGEVKRGRVVVGTVEGDLHDLGKNVVAMMLRSAGLEVYDLGRDVRTETFVERARELDADIIGVSSLMTTTRPYQRELIEELERLGLRERFKVLVGGGPVTREWAEEIGADGYGRDAMDAVKEAKRLLGIEG
ncbi:MAG: B12-binding domain-containing protein [Candidatus Bathyarchaeia archaeon]